mgnify:CR=1 FL=1
MAEYLRYVIKTVEPIRISDDSISQSGQTDTLRYIPGTSIRGLVINALAKEEDFEDIKENLFSKDINYLNAYPIVEKKKLIPAEKDSVAEKKELILSKKDSVIEKKELIPSPKGFYEDKGEQDIQNVVVKGKFKDGYKRASLGRYCYIENGCIYYYNINTGSDMKIKINLEQSEKQNVFRNEYIMPGQLFCGYIRVNQEELKERIKKTFSNIIFIGNARSAGFGKCEVIECDYVSNLPYEQYLSNNDLQSCCYMMLLSNTAMRNEHTGELCGLDTKQLAKKLGVENLEIEFCSTSTVNVRGYNRTWQTKIPSVVMFEQGSVFKLKFDGNITEKCQNIVCDTGIGIRTNEGCGRVLFLKDYESVNGKEKIDVSHAEQKENIVTHNEDAQVLKMVAKQYYARLLEQKIKRFIVEKRFTYGTISSSQLNKLYAIATMYQYQPKQAKQAIQDYLNYSMEKEQTNNTQKERGSFLEIKKFVERLFEVELEKFMEESIKHSIEENLYSEEEKEQLFMELAIKDTIMGMKRANLFSAEEQDRWKLKLLIELIRYENKKGNE